MRTAEELVAGIVERMRQQGIHPFIWFTGPHGFCVPCYLRGRPHVVQDMLAEWTPEGSWMPTVYGVCSQCSHEIMAQFEATLTETGTGVSVLQDMIHTHILSQIRSRAH